MYHRPLSTHEARGRKLNFNLKHLEAFVWVADLGSFRKAADRLNTTQPNISSRIAALETALDENGQRIKGRGDMG